MTPGLSENFGGKAQLHNNIPMNKIFSAIRKGYENFTSKFEEPTPEFAQYVQNALKNLEEQFPGLIENFSISGRTQYDNTEHAGVSINGIGFVLWKFDPENQDPAKRIIEYTGDYESSSQMSDQNQLEI